MNLSNLKPATKNCAGLATAWAAWRGEGLLPQRSDMRLEDITHVLPYICLADVISETEIIFRLAGTFVREIMGVELTGRNFLDLTEPEYRASRGARTMQNITIPCGAIWIWEIEFAGRKCRQVEILSLPARPNDPIRPMQMISVFGLLEPANRPRAVAHLQQLAAADQHNFIDIGSGLPPND